MKKGRKRWRDPAGLDWCPGGATAAVGRRSKGQVPREGRGSSCWAGGRGSMMFSSEQIYVSIKKVGRPQQKKEQFQQKKIAAVVTGK
ncbi:uncharacterized protein LOC119365218 isoform X3 [Triticum dicoccoides]|uniref:uncharacterized protein LOC119365218 isoform X3 n=1 Tax=Triticum dicoccoides TaxID=85692 RepID=UPI00188E5FF9|nr:uncharacterized protein LOC119365218 isoform X3 [Triticum dicoccoides]